MSVKCNYHPEREATTKCEKCGKFICLECRTAIHRYHGTTDSSYSTRHEICIPCYYDTKLERYSFNLRPTYICFGVLVIGILIFLILDQTIGLHFDNSPIGPFTIVMFFISGVFLILLILFFRNKKRVPVIYAELTRQKKHWLSTGKTDRICPNCGNNVEVGIYRCPSCSSKIKYY